MTDLTGFSKRVFDDPRFHSDVGEHGELVIAVSDQLLVSESVSPPVRNLLPGFGIVRIGKLLGGPPRLRRPPGVKCEDVEIFKIVPPAGTKLDIFAVTRHLRAALHGHAGPNAERKVSPNHVLIPAMEGHSCPWGPPAAVPAAPMLPAVTAPRLAVTVIDSGFQWRAAWGRDPLNPHLVPQVDRAEYIDTRPPWAPGGGWTAGTGEDVCTAAFRNTSGFRALYALAGHANFIAGVIAHHCPPAQIKIVSHNGTFEPTADNFSTEASVARSLCRNLNASLIDLGFAFACLDGLVSHAWDVTFEFIGRGRSGSGPLVVCPAGNQDSQTPRYPGALSYMDQAKFPNVIAVGSTDPAANRAPFRLFDRLTRSFTNRGPWVTCSADGHDVMSTFLPVLMSTEDPTPRGNGQWPNPVDFRNGWASWNGTSFATPKVVAEIANRMPANGNSAMRAWQALQRAYPNAPRNRGLGIEFPF